jgi:hypothetical protein
MDSFLVGFLSAVIIVFLIVTVVGLVGVFRLFKSVRHLDEVIKSEVEQVHYRLDNDVSREFEEIRRKIDDEICFVERSIDSRINKMENRFKK